MPDQRPGIEGIARSFIDCFNRRDADGLLALVDEEVEFRPSRLARVNRTYRGHDGVREWLTDLKASKATHQVRIGEIHSREPSGFVVLTEVLSGEEVLAQSAMVADLGEDGLIIRAQGYLSDWETLRRQLKLW